MIEKRTEKSSAKDVFSYLLMISMFYVGVINFITLLFQSINVKFPDPLSFYLSGAYSSMRFAISALLIVWPVYILMSWLINKDLRAHKEKADVWVRKWLLYLTLFVSAVTVIIDLITLINTFLGGEITTRFVLKVLVVLVVAAAVFAYYLWELKRHPAEKTARPAQAAIATSLLIVLAIIIGFIFVGTPGQQRAVRADDERVASLSGIQNQVLSFWVDRRELPADLAALSDPFNGYQAPTDPLTSQPFTYRTTGPLSFELCATFERASVSGASGRDVYSFANPYPIDPKNQIWDHGAGETCFERTIDPSRYPVTK